MMFFKDPYYPETAVYDSIRTVHRVPFRLEKHLRRLEQSAKLMGFDLPKSIDEISNMVKESIQGTQFSELFIRVTATPKNIFVEVRDLIIDRKVYEGVRVNTVTLQRKDVKIKRVYAPQIEAAYDHAIQEGYYEALLMNQHGKITEGTRSNILWVKNNMLFWCDHSLSGVTQEEVLTLAQKRRIETREFMLNIHELGSIDELFLTHTSKGVVPIVEVNGVKIRNAKVGKITKILMDDFNTLAFPFRPSPYSDERRNPLSQYRPKGLLDGACPGPVEWARNGKMIMGILNVTPDSFSDGGLFLKAQKALDRIEEMQQEGADIIDIGAQSTAGPDAMITAEAEWLRLEPVLSAIDYKKTFVSVDTFRASVAEKALKLGAQMINDVTGLRGDQEKRQAGSMLNMEPTCAPACDEVMIRVLLRYKPYVCLMYSSYETPYAGREVKHFEDIMLTIKLFLKRQTDLLISKGFPREKIIIDPGLGRFLSNDPAVSFEVIDRLAELKSLGFPILIGPSRKGFLGGEMKERDERTVEISKKCLKNGANILRVHDIKSHKMLRGA